MRRILSTVSLFFMSSLPLAAEPCQSILSDFSMCPTPGWSRLDIELPKGVMVWQSGAVTAKMIIEGHVAGSAPDVEEVVAFIKQSVRASLPASAHVDFEEQEVASDNALRLGSLAYDLELPDRTVQVHHSFLVSESVTLQFLTSTGTDDHAASMAAHQDFMSSFRMTEPSHSI